MLPRNHRMQRPRPSRREQLITAAAGLTLLWTTWMPGNTRPWVMAGTLILSAVTFALLFLPVGDGQTAEARGNLRQLLRSIPFWLGLLVVIYVSIQAANPRFTIVRVAGGYFRTFSHEYVSWLPSGLVAPADMESSVMMVKMLGGLLFFTSAIWVGIRNRSSYRVLLWTMAISAAAWSLLGMLQRATDAGKMLWFFTSYNRNFWGTLTNENHAAALLNLGLIGALALFLHAFGTGRNTMLRGSPHLLCVPLSIACITGVVNTSSRAGMLITLIILVIFSFIGLYRLQQALRTDKRGLAVMVVFVGLLAILVIGTLPSLDKKRLRREWRTALVVADNPATNLRYYINQATFDLIELRPVTGWGSGSYRYFIQQTQFNYEPLEELTNNPRPNLRRQIMFAHNDYLQYLAELGWVGVTPLILLVLYLVVLPMRRWRGLDAGLLFGVVAICAFLIHATIEFFFYRPAVLFTFWALVITVWRMIDLRARRVMALEGP